MDVSLLLNGRAGSGGSWSGSQRGPGSAFLSWNLSQSENKSRSGSGRGYGSVGWSRSWSSGRSYSLSGGRSFSWSVV